MSQPIPSPGTTHVMEAYKLLKAAFRDEKKAVWWLSSLMFENSDGWQEAGLTRDEERELTYIMNRVVGWLSYERLDNPRLISLPCYAFGVRVDVEQHPKCGSIIIINVFGRKMYKQVLIEPFSDPFVYLMGQIQGNQVIAHAPDGAIGWSGNPFL